MVSHATPVILILIAEQLGLGRLLVQQVSLEGCHLVLYVRVILTHLFCNFHCTCYLSVQTVTVWVKQKRCWPLNLRATVFLSSRTDWRGESACLSLLSHHFEADIDFIDISTDLNIDWLRIIVVVGVNPSSLHWIKHIFCLWFLCISMQLKIII